MRKHILEVTLGLTGLYVGSILISQVDVWLGLVCVVASLLILICKVYSFTK